MLNLNLYTSSSYRTPSISQSLKTLLSAVSVDCETLGVYRLVQKASHFYFAISCVSYSISLADIPLLFFIAPLVR